MRIKQPDRQTQQDTRPVQREREAPPPVVIDVPQAPLVSARALGGLLFQVSAADPWVLSATALAMALVGAAASYVPARRASRVDPIVSMRGG